MKDLRADIIDEFAAWDGIREDAEADYRNRRIDNGAAYRRQWKADARLKRKVATAKIRPTHCGHCGGKMQVVLRGGIRRFCDVRCRTAAECAAMAKDAAASPLRSEQSRKVAERIAQKRAA